jgi:acetyl/propionyl-CoA carboxylase alpha subunit
MRYGLDLVRAQIEIAHGGPLPVPGMPRGHAIEARIYAEDPSREFLPTTGRILELEWPHHPWVRIDAGIASGLEVTPFFDPLLAKVIAWGQDREEARRRLVHALRDMVLLGLPTNQGFLLDILTSDFFVRGETTTTTLEDTAWPAPPAPPEIAAAAATAMRLLAVTRAGAGDGSGAGSAGTNEDANPGPGSDRFSPWRTLGGFRLGGVRGEGGKGEGGKGEGGA